MRKIALITLALALSAGSALAADLPSRKEPVLPPPPPPPLWTGFYAGLNAGGTWANNAAVNAQTWNLYSYEGYVTNANRASAALLSGSGSNRSNSSGFMGGGQIGYNWQIAGFGVGSGIVTGIEADIQGIAGSGGTASRWTAAATDATYPNANFSPYSLLGNQYGQSNLQYFGTVRGRIGILAMPTLLIYGTGGLAYGGVSASIQNTVFWRDMGVNSYNYLVTGNGSLSNTLVGWTAGGGLEWMILPNWSLKAEYLYYDLGNMAGSIVNTYAGFGDAAGQAGVSSATNYSGRVSGNLVRAGVNYHFSWAAAPVVAKY